MSAHALYQLSLKALIHQDDKVLVLNTPDGYLDFPGGRVEESERTAAWQGVLQREIAEELGSNTRITIGRQCFTSKRQYAKNGITHHVLAVFFICQFIEGDIDISDEHASYTWLSTEEIIASNKHMSVDERICLQQYLRAQN